MKLLLIILGCLFFVSGIFARGSVYIVLGSDTGIWEGAGMSTHHNYYSQDLYTNPLRNTYAVMDRTFRENIRGTDNMPLKLTWWMHGGNMFRHARNNNIPYSNTIALFLMKKYHGDAIAEFGDELTMHYHTWEWSDYDQDGIYYWNQTPGFEDCRADFDWTLAQYLLEEEIFPVSFRSGWHYMDNEWQNYLDELLPFSLHNDYPNKNVDTVEPLDNIYDWSRCSPYFEPFHPSPVDYQLEGSCTGWNVRSIYTKRTTLELLTEVFQRARDGNDQVVCIWSHLPETDFLEQIQTVHDKISAVHAQFSDVDYFYKTAIEAMQAWFKTEDFNRPVLEINEIKEADRVRLYIRTDEPIFQTHPVVAVKDIYERYWLIDCSVEGLNRWEAVVPLSAGRIAKIGVAVTDAAGNQAIKLLRYLPEDLFIDNSSDGLRPLTDNYTLSTESAWGTDALQFSLAAGDSAVMAAELNVVEKRDYRLFVQFAPVSSPVDSASCLLLRDGDPVFKKTISGAIPERTWIYLDKIELNPESQYEIQLKSINERNTVGQFSPDGIRISAMIPERFLVTDPTLLNFGTVSIFDTARVILKLANHGDQPLTVHELQINSVCFLIEGEVPLEISAFETREIPIAFYADQISVIEDTLKIFSNDPQDPVKTVVVSVSATEYFAIADNDDPDNYAEFGDWQTSNAQAYGTSSRYVYLSKAGGTHAEFEARLEKSGLYDLMEIVPQTVNASDNAMYEIRISGVPIDSVYLDQNLNSGTWCTIGRYYFPAKVPVQVRVIDTGRYSTGIVLRADAVKLQLIREISNVSINQELRIPHKTRLFQNYPNPFNPVTRILYEIGNPGPVTLTLLDAAGRRIRTLKEGYHSTGMFEVDWDGRDDQGIPAASGIYFCCLRSGDHLQVRKMVLLH